MKEITFKAKMLTIGGSQGVVIPKALTEMLTRQKKYLFTIKEVENDANSQIDMG